MSSNPNAIVDMTSRLLVKSVHKVGHIIVIVIVISSRACTPCVEVATLHKADMM